MFLNGEVLHEY